MRSALLALAALAAALPATAAEWRDLAPPAAPGAQSPHLAEAAAGPLLTWLEKLPGGHALRFARFADGAWTAPVTVASGDLFANWADFPASVESAGGDLYAHWLEKNGRDPYAYAIELARSTDGGRSWQRLGPLHEDRVASEHGFVSFLREGSGVRAFWLDGRQMPRGGAMTLRTARIEDGRVGAGEAIDERTCECCQTGAAVTARGPRVVWRGRSPAEIRDVAIAGADGHAWSAPRIVAADGWKIAGCPVNGPAVAADGESLAVGWFTGAEPPRVQVAFSSDAGASFRPPVELDRGEPIGRVDLLALSGGEVLVSWLSRRGGATTLVLRRVATDGRAGAPWTLATPVAPRSSSFPRALLVGSEVWLAWTESGETSRLRVGAVPLATIPAPR